MFLETSEMLLNADRVLYFSVEAFHDKEGEKKYVIAAHYEPNKFGLWLHNEYNTSEEAERALHNLAVDLGALETEV